MSDNPYAAAADTYWQAGWRGVLPLPAGKKSWPPSGYTGAGGRDPSYPDVYTWVEGKEGAGNIGLRLPIDVIGVDVDAYDDKPGAATLTAAEKAHGALPPTWRTTSRDDGVSGIRLYRVPPGLAWDQIGDGIETIQRSHRYAVVWPSLHPEGRTYRWIGPDGIVSTVIPHIDELPSLPDTWVTAYSRGEAADIPRNDMPGTLAAAWLAGLPNASSDPCQRMREATAADVVAFNTGHGSAHDAGCQATARFVRLAAEGHAGVLRIMGSVHKAFTDNVTNPRRKGSTRTPTEAEAEWRGLIISAVNLVSADMPTAPSCDCAGALTALIVGDPTRPTPPTQAAPLTTAPPTAGANALAPQPDPAHDDSAIPDEIRTSWWPRNLDPVLSGEQTEPPPTILTREDGQPLWYAGKINGLIGESESGKTWIALLAVAQELHKGNQVLYLDFEDAAPGIVSRLRALGVTDDVLGGGLDYADPAESLHAAASGDLGELITTRDYSLIVVDGFNASMTLLGLDLMSNTDVTKFFQLLLKPLAKTGAAVAYVDHIGKNAQDDSKGGIGAQAKRAMTTGCVVKVKVTEPFGRGMNGRLHLAVDKDRAGHVRGTASQGRGAGVAELTSDMVTGAVGVVIKAPDLATRTERHEGRMTSLMEAVSEWLETQPATTSKNAIRRSIEGKNDDIDNAIDDLISGGYVHRAKVGQGFSHASIKPFRAPVPHRAPTVPRAQGPGPSNDRAPVPLLYRRGTGHVNGGGDEAQLETTPTVPQVETRSEPYRDVTCKRCFGPTPEGIAKVWDGMCNKCAGETGLS